MGGPVELTEEQFAAALNLNIGPVYRTARAVVPHMLRQGGGAIVNISSLAAIRWPGYPYFAYYATKAAVNQATRSAEHTSELQSRQHLVCRLLLDQKTKARVPACAGPLRAYRRT